jgi:methylaspartate mutase sigma subunit
MGFNRVYPPGIKIDDVLDTIKLDLGGIWWKHICLSILVLLSLN